MSETILAAAAVLLVFAFGWFALLMLAAMYGDMRDKGEG